MDNVKLHVNNKNELDEVMSVAELVFKPNTQEKEKYHNKVDWLNKINDGLLISALVGNEIVGFAICYKKDNDLHIWNVGVLVDFRRFGVWKKMYEEIYTYALKSDYKTISLNTYKEKFPGMYNFVTSEGFTEYKTELDSMQGITKSSLNPNLKPSSPLGRGGSRSSFLFALPVS